MINDQGNMEGLVTWELTGPDGVLKASGESHNIITDIGDQLYAMRGSGATNVTPPATPTGMRLGTGSTAVAKNGAGAALVTRLTDGHQAFDGTFPSYAKPGTVAVITYKVTYAAGKATTASPITEAVIVNDTIATDTSTAAANTISRVLLTGIGSKGASDTLTVTWTHSIGS